TRHAAHRARPIAHLEGDGVSGVRALVQHRQQHVVALVLWAERVRGTVAQPPRATVRIAAATTVGGAEEAPIDVHEDVDARMVVQGHLEWTGADPASDQSLTEKLRDHAGVVRNSGARGPQAGAGEDRSDRARTVEPDPAAVVPVAL